MVKPMSGILKVVAVGGLFALFCYYFHEGEQLRTLALQLGALWLILREARIRLQERGNLPPHRRSSR